MLSPFDASRREPALGRLRRALHGPLVPRGRPPLGAQQELHRGSVPARSGLRDAVPRSRARGDRPAERDAPSPRCASSRRSASATSTRSIPSTAGRTSAPRATRSRRVRERTRAGAAGARRRRAARDARAARAALGRGAASASARPWCRSTTTAPRASPRSVARRSASPRRPRGRDAAAVTGGWRLPDLLVSRSPADPPTRSVASPVADAARRRRRPCRARARPFPAWRDAGFEARAACCAASPRSRASAATSSRTLIAREIGKAIWDARGEARLLPAKVDGDARRRHALRRADRGRRRRPRHLPPARRARRARSVQLPGAPPERPHRAGARDRQHGRAQAERAHAGGRRVDGRAAGAEAGLPDRRARRRAGRRRRRPRARAARGRRRRALHRLVGGGTRARRGDARSAGQAARARDGRQERDGRAAPTPTSSSRSPRRRSRSAPPPASAARACRASSSRRRSLDAFAERLARVLAGVQIGAPLDPEVFMGPLVSQAAHEKVTPLPRARSGGRRRARAPRRPRSTLPPPWIAPGLVALRRRAAGPSRTTATRSSAPRRRLYPIDDLDARDRRGERLRLRPRRVGDDARPRALRALRRPRAHRHPQLEPRHDRRERPAALRRPRPQRQRPAGRHPLDALLQRARSPISNTRAASTRRRCRRGCPTMNERFRTPSPRRTRTNRAPAGAAR